MLLVSPLLTVVEFVFGVGVVIVGTCALSGMTLDDTSKIYKESI